jgi:ABC-type sulfate transport system permease component
MEKQNITFAQEAARLLTLLTQIFLGMPYAVRTFARALTRLEDRVRRWL